MHVLGVNTNEVTNYVSLYFRERLEHFVIDGRTSTCYSKDIEDWLAKHGIEDDYIIRDLFSQSYCPRGNNFSYAVVEMNNPEHIVMLKMGYKPYNRTLTTLTGVKK